MSQARSIHPGTTYLVTRRTERRYCLLRPDAQVNAFILYAFIVSAQRHGILVHAFCAMSTHLHYVVTDPLGQLPQFLAMFHRLVAQGVKTIRNWDGAVWNRSQTSVVELCTRQAIVEKIAYTLANPVEAGLVWTAEEWPGIKTNVTDIGQYKLEAQRPSHYFRATNAKWDPQVELELSLPPSIPDTDAPTFLADIQYELETLENAAHDRIPAHEVLGAEQIAQISPETRITSHERSRQLNPTSDGRGNAKNAKEVRTKATAKQHAFRAAYREALQKWRAGDRSVVFPAGTYMMRVMHAVNVAVLV